MICNILLMHRAQFVSYLLSEHFRSGKNQRLKSILALFFINKETEETKSHIILGIYRTKAPG